MFNGTIKTEGDKIVLVIKDNLEQLKEYKNIGTDGEVIEGEFFASFKKAGEDNSHTITFTKEENNQLIINSVNGKGDNIAGDLGLDTNNPEISELELFMHSALVYSKKVLEITTQELEAVKKEAEEKQKELQTKFDAAEKEKAELQQRLDNLTKDGTAIEDLFADGSIKTEIEGLIELTGQGLKDKIKDLYDSKLSDSKLRSELKEIFYEKFQEGIIQFIKDGKSADEIVELTKETLKFFDKESKIAGLQQQLTEKEDKIKELETAKKEDEGKQKELRTKLDTAQQGKQDLEAEVKKLKAIDSTMLQQQLKNKDTEIQRLQKENKELEDKSKAIQQPKQSNAARYTATAGMGLAVGLVAFTALERTVKLEMLVMIGIAVASALVAGGITYAVLPSTQVDGAKAQEVSGDKKSK